MRMFPIVNIDRILVQQLVRYAIVGLALNTLAYLLYLLLATCWLSPQLTISILYPLFVLLSFLGHRRVTFNHRGRMARSGYRFLLSYAFGYLINYALIALFYEKLGYPHQLVQGAAIFIVAGCMFIMQKLYVFSPPQQRTT